MGRGLRAGGRSLLWVLIGIVGGTVCLAQGRLDAGFRTPPGSARPHTWWHWVNGNVTREGITADLEAMKRVGIGGAQIFNVDCGLPAGPVLFMSPEWRALITHAVKEADRLGIELCIHNCAGWSSSGGPWITPEHSMQILTWSETTVRGPQRFAGTLLQPPSRMNYYRDIAALAFRTPPGETAERKLRLSQINVKAAFERGDRILPDLSPTPPDLAIPREGVLNLTAQMDAQGRLVWDAPEGEWTILRLGHTTTGKDNHPSIPEGRGLECDKMSREAMDQHWSGMMATVLGDLGPLAGRVLNNALIDSYEVGSQNWTPKFREEFRRRRGYDPLPFMPVVTGRVVDSIAVSERFLWDFRRTIADLFADNYFGYFGELCRKHGMLFSVEPYGNGAFDNIQSGGLADIPMGEFWVGGAAIETTKLAASIAHTHGRKYVGAEAFTADDMRGRWLVDPYSIKALGDLVFCNGVNRYIFHRYAHQPWKDLYPGLTMGPWGMHLERTVTWWSQGAAWLRYVARCQYLLQSGLFVADACYFYGDSGPNDLLARSALRPELPDGYDYDGCDAATLRRMTVKNGQIVLPDGMRYRVLILPETTFMTPATLREIRRLAREGATIIGPKPAHSPSLSDYPRCDDEVRRMADEVWGDCDGKTVQERRYGRGRILWGKPLRTVFAESGVAPDFSYRSDSRDTRLVYIHRRADGADIYFVSNQRYRNETAEAVFRVSGRQPELWDPMTGQIVPAPVFRQERGRTVVPLTLEPAGSVFVVFRKPLRDPDHLTQLTRTGPKLPPGSRIQVEIRRAFYGAADGRGADVTAKVAAMVAEGTYAIPATNAVFGDPVVNVVKQLTVEYLLNGRERRQVVAENETMELAESRDPVSYPAFEVMTDRSGAAVMVPWQAGVYQARTARGRMWRMEVREPARVLTLPNAWRLRFPPGKGAPPEIRLDRLVSWTEHAQPGVRYFSGTAEYTTTFHVPAAMLSGGRAVSLDLGRVKNFAEVRVNGRSTGVLWKEPFRLDVTGLLKPGQNTLSVRVTNLWPNRLIGDAQHPEEVEWSGDAIGKWPDWVWKGAPRPPTPRLTFTTWRFYRKDSPLLGSGLLGPVTLRSAPKIVLKK